MGSSSLNIGNGTLLRCSAFTSSGTWTNSADVKSIFVEVVGGGGAGDRDTAGIGGPAGGTSSFGGFLSASGGVANNGSSVGGNGSGGDINLVGTSGGQNSSAGGNQAMGGKSVWGEYGSGGRGGSNGFCGGSGGYSARIIKANLLPATVTVTIGAGGSPALVAATNGKAGIVLIYEYGA